MSKHTKGTWYLECIKHSMPYVPDGTPNDSPLWEALEEWEDTHFSVGDEFTFSTCEENKLSDTCLECTDRKQERLEDSEVFVPWHGCNSVRDASGKFVTRKK